MKQWNEFANDLMSLGVYFKDYNDFIAKFS